MTSAPLMQVNWLPLIAAAAFYPCLLVVCTTASLFMHVFCGRPYNTPMQLLLLQPAVATFLVWQRGRGRNGLGFQCTCLGCVRASGLMPFTAKVEPAMAMNAQCTVAHCSSPCDHRPLGTIQAA